MNHHIDWEKLTPLVLASHEWREIESGGPARISVLGARRASRSRAQARIALWDDSTDPWHVQLETQWRLQVT